MIRCHHIVLFKFLLAVARNGVLTKTNSIFFHSKLYLFTSQFTYKLHCQWQFRFDWFLVSESYSSFVCTRSTVTVSAEVLFLIVGGGGRVQLMCWAAQMKVNPPDRLYTLPPGPWLSQTSAWGQRSGLAFLCPNPPWVPTYPLSRGSPLPVAHAAMTCSFFLCLRSGPIVSKSLSLLLSLYYSWSYSVSVSLSLLFFPLISLSLVSLFLFCYRHLWSTAELTCLQGKQLPLFPGPSVFPSFSIPPSLPPCPVPCRGIGGISLPGSSWGRLHLSQGFPLKRHFSPLENCSLPTVTLSA